VANAIVCTSDTDPVTGHRYQRAYAQAIGTAGIDRLVADL
jgi:predicted neutral ceramidase superfamily lipid hydrolase